MDYEQFPIGETILSYVGNNCEATVSILETRLEFALLETTSKGMRYIINAEPHPWHEEVSRLTFMPYPGFFYNFQDAGRKSYNFCGEDSPAQNLVAHDVTIDGNALCTEDHGGGHFSTYIGEVETQYQLDCELNLTHDNKGFIYQAVDNYQRRNYQVVRKGRIFFDGHAGKIRISGNREKYSWIGIMDNDEYEYPYLDSQKINRPIEFFVPDTLAVSHCCTRYMFCEREDYDAPIILVIDGKQTDIRCDDCFNDESCMFSEDASSYCFACTRGDKVIMVVDDEIIAQHDAVFDACFIGNDLYYVGVDFESDICTFYKNKKTVSTWPYIEKHTAAIRDDGKHYCFYANEYGLKSNDSKWHFVVDGNPVWSFDAIPKRDCGYFHPEVYPVEFIDDSVYCVAIKNSNLVLYHHKL